MIGLQSGTGQPVAFKGSATPPPRLHPLALDGYQRFFKGKRGFKQEDTDALREGLLQYVSDPQAMWGAVSSLGLLAVLLEQEGDSDSANMLRELIASGAQHLAPIAGDISKALGIQAPEQVENRARQGQQLISSDDLKRAAVHDSEAPQGSLPLYAVDYAMVSARFRELRLVQGPEWRAEFPGLSSTPRPPQRQTFSGWKSL